MPTTSSPLVTALPVEPSPVVAITTPSVPEATLSPIVTSPTLPAVITPPVECMVCGDPSVPWPCCGCALFCAACTRRCRNSVPEPSHHLPHPRCPNCRADYPRDVAFELLFRVVCTQLTQPLEAFVTRNPNLDGTGITLESRPLLLNSLDTNWCATVCCERRVHRACLGGLTDWAICPMCIDDFCSECHRVCNPLLCCPRPRSQPPCEDTKYDRCQNPPLLSPVVTPAALFTPLLLSAQPVLTPHLWTFHHLSLRPVTEFLNLDHRMHHLPVLKEIILSTMVGLALSSIQVTLLPAPVEEYGILLNVRPVDLRWYPKLSLTFIYSIFLKQCTTTMIFSWRTVRLMLTVEFQASVPTVEMLSAKKILSDLPVTL